MLIRLSDSQAVRKISRSATKTYITTKRKTSDKNYGKQNKIINCSIKI